MRTPDTAGLNADRKGMLVAILCFVHCVAGPALLAFAGLASLRSMSEEVEPLFLLSSIVFGAAALVPAYRNKHGRLSCLVLFGCGICCLLLKRQIEFGAAAEAIATGAGALLIIGAHTLNRRFSKRCPCCPPVRRTEREGIEA